MIKTFRNSAYDLIGLILFFSVLLSSCNIPTLVQPASPVTPRIVDTPIPSATPDLRSRLVTTDNGTILRPEVEINDKNFPQVKMLGTLGSGAPVVVQFSPDDSLLAFGTSLGDVYIYDTVSLKLITTIHTNLAFEFPTHFNDYGMCDPCGKVVISPDNKLLGVLSIVGDIQIWSLESRQQMASSTEGFIFDVMHRRLAGEGVRLTGSGWRNLLFSDDNRYLGVFVGTEWWPPGACLYPLTEECEKYFKRAYFVLSTSGSVWCGSKFGCPTSPAAETQTDLRQFDKAFTFAPENPNLPPIPLPTTMNRKTQYQGKSKLSPKQQIVSADGTQSISYDQYGIANNFPRYGHSEVIYAGTLWDIPNSKIINTFSFPYVDVYAFSHDLGSVAYMGSEGITVLDLQSRARPREIPFANCLGKLAFSPDGTILAGYFRNVIYFCDPLTGAVTHTISVPTGFVSNLAFSPDSKFVASTGQTWGNYLINSHDNYDPFVYIWNVSDGSLVTSLEHQGDTEVVKFSPDGKYIAIGAAIDRAGPEVTFPKDKRFVLWAWDGNNATRLTEKELGYGVGNLAFSPNSQQVLIAANPLASKIRRPAFIYLYDIQHDVLSKSSYPTLGCDGTPNLLQFSPTENEFLVGDGCGVVEVSISGEISNPEFFPIHDSSAQFQEYSNNYVAPNFSVITYSADSGHKIKISNITDSHNKEISGGYDYMNLAFSPDGKVIYGGGMILGVISVWGIPVENK